ncbi:MAG: Flp pilus assembly protein CpaB [Acidobacteriaceae bacterium]
MINRRLTIAFIIALVVSGGFTFWLSQKFSKAPRPAPPPPKSQYVAAAANMEAGQAIRADNLRMVDWPAAVPLAGAYTNPQGVVGRVVLYPLASGEPILDRQLSAQGGGGLTVKIPDGMRAISLRTDEVVGVAGFLLPGTHVDVLVTLHLANQPDPVTSTVLQDAEILATGQKTEPDPEGKPATATVVTLLVKPEDAERVVLASTQGTVHFVLRNGVDRAQFTGPPALLSQLSGFAAPVPDKAQAPKPLPFVVVTKPYTVETFLGSKQRTDNFQ